MSADIRQTDTIRVFAVTKRHLFVGGEREVGAHHAVTIVSEQNDASLLRVHVKCLEMRRVPAGVDSNRHLHVAQHAVVRVRQCLPAKKQEAQLSQSQRDASRH